MLLLRPPGHNPHSFSLTGQASKRVQPNDIPSSRPTGMEKYVLSSQLIISLLLVSYWYESEIIVYRRFLKCFPPHPCHRTDILFQTVSITFVHCLSLSMTLIRLNHRWRTSRIWWDDYVVVIPWVFDLFSTIILWTEYTNKGTPFLGPLQRCWPAPTSLKELSPRLRIFSIPGGSTRSDISPLYGMFMLWLK